MIVKSFETNKIISQKSNIILLYGSNQGFKNQVINDCFIKDFKGEIYKTEESEILNNEENFISGILNKSLFEEKKLIIIYRGTEKIIDIITDIINRKFDGVRIIIEANVLEKKSKLRNLFEKEQNLTCIPFYEDNEKSLSYFIQSYIAKKKIKLSNEIINLLVERSKGDRGNLVNELKKIENLSLTKKNFKFEDVMELTNLAENYSVFELSNNYLAKNSSKVSRILNENNYNSEDCILILRTILNKSKRLLKLKDEIEQNKQIDEVVSSFKPTIFWKEKEIVKQQLKSWTTNEIIKIIYKINDLEIIIKKNSTNSLNFVSDFIQNY
tara:strand:+ start:1712 stop:2689 length:978 start_codon:yes stop_codon:yes gene_type:complete